MKRDVLSVQKQYTVWCRVAMLSLEIKLILAKSNKNFSSKELFLARSPTCKSHYEKDHTKNS